MTIGLKANVSGTSGTIQIGGADQITVDNAGGLTATTVTGTTVTQGGVAMPRMVLGTAQNTTSGTAIDFTGIPSWVKRVTMLFNGVSLNLTSSLNVQVGSGSVQTTGYTVWGASAIGGTTTAGFGAASNTGFSILSGNATIAVLGSIVLTNITGNVWVSTTCVGGYNGAQAIGTSAGGTVTLSGALDRVRLTTLNGTDTFDAGSVNILYEG